SISSAQKPSAVPTSRQRFPSSGGHGSCAATPRLSTPSNHGTSDTPVMPTDQYHEPADELSAEIRTFARMIASLQEEAEAIGWYEQRMSLEHDEAAHAIMQNAQQEEFKHFAMSLEFLSRRNAKWRTALQNVLFKEGDIVELGE